MSEELEKLEKQIEEKISNANNLEHLNSIKIEVFGKKGLITNHLKLLSGLSENERKIKGKVINDIKNKINQLLQEKNKTLNDNEISKKLEKEEIDITLSPRPFDEGKLNPITQTIAEVTTIFQKMGFETALGPDIELMVDVQYKWETADQAIRTVKDWAEFNIYFLETPVWTDNLDDYARMHEEAPMKIAAGEWLSTAHEFKDLIERGKVDVAQPDIGRVGGLTEAKKVSDIVDANNRIIVPHCWKTSISISATAHFAFNTPSCKFIEYLPPQLCHETLRRELAIEGFDFKDGLIQLPTKSGLGIDLNQDAVKKYRVD